MISFRVTPHALDSFQRSLLLYRMLMDNGLAAVRDLNGLGRNFDLGSDIELIRIHQLWIGIDDFR